MSKERGTLSSTSTVLRQDICKAVVLVIAHRLRDGLEGNLVQRQRVESCCVLRCQLPRLVSGVCQVDGSSRRQVDGQLATHGSHCFGVQGACLPIIRGVAGLKVVLTYHNLSEMIKEKQTRVFLIPEVPRLLSRGQNLEVEFKL